MVDYPILGSRSPRYRRKLGSWIHHLRCVRTRVALKRSRVLYLFSQGRLSHFGFSGPLAIVASSVSGLTSWTEVASVLQDVSGTIIRGLLSSDPSAPSGTWFLKNNVSEHCSELIFSRSHDWFSLTVETLFSVVFWSSFFQLRFDLWHLATCISPDSYKSQFLSDAGFTRSVLDDLVCRGGLCSPGCLRHRCWWFAVFYSICSEWHFAFL